MTPAREWWRPPVIAPLPVTPPDRWTPDQRRAMLACVRQQRVCRCGAETVVAVLVEGHYRATCEGCGRENQMATR